VTTDQSTVKMFYKINNAHFDPWSLLIAKKVLSIKNDLAAIKTTLGPDRSLFITLFWLLVNLLHQACIASRFRKPLVTMHWTQFRVNNRDALAFAHGKRITAYCSLRDSLNGNVAIFNVDKWRHSDVIVIKLTAGTQHKIPYKTYIWIFSYFTEIMLFCNLFMERPSYIHHRLTCSVTMPRLSYPHSQPFPCQRAGASLPVGLDGRERQSNGLS